MSIQFDPAELQIFADFETKYPGVGYKLKREGTRVMIEYEYRDRDVLAGIPAQQNRLLAHAAQRLFADIPSAYEVYLLGGKGEYKVNTQGGQQRGRSPSAREATLHAALTTFFRTWNAEEKCGAGCDALQDILGRGLGSRNGRAIHLEDAAAVMEAALYLYEQCHPNPTLAELLGDLRENFWLVKD